MNQYEVQQNYLQAAKDVRRVLDALEYDSDASSDDEYNTIKWYNQKMATIKTEDILAEYQRKMTEPREPEDKISLCVITPYEYMDDVVFHGYEGDETDSYGLEGEYKDDFDTWKQNYHWYGKTFQEWIREKQDDEKETYTEQWEDEVASTGGKYYV